MQNQTQKSEAVFAGKDYPLSPLFLAGLWG